MGLSALRSSAIFFIILDIAFSCVPKLLKGGFIYFFQTMIEKKRRIELRMIDHFYMLSSDAESRTSPPLQGGDVFVILLEEHGCGPAVAKLTCMSTCTLTIVTLDAVKNFFPQVLEGFVSIIRVSFPVILDKLSYFGFC